MSNDYVVIEINAPPELYQAATASAKAQGVTIDDWVNDALEYAINTRLDFTKQGVK